MNVAIILAGGVGTRVGANIPKQFIQVEGHPVLAYTIKKFQDSKDVDAIEIVCHKDYLKYVNSFKDKYGFSKINWIIEGGNDFQHSVINGIYNLKNKIKDDDIVIIHYGASPFVEEDIIEDCIKVAREKGNSTSATPCFLLTGSNDDGKQSTKWIDRDKIMQLNAPQCFRYGYVYNLYEEGKRRNILEKIEPHTTTLMYELGEKIYFAKGNQTNIKITTKEDLLLFTGYVLVKNIKL